MKKMKLLLFVFLFIPMFSINAEQKICNYRESSKYNGRDEEARLTLYLDCTGTSCHPTKGEVYSNIYTYRDKVTRTWYVSGRSNVQSFDATEISECPSELGTDQHDRANGAITLKLEMCGSSDKFGCFHFLDSSEENKATSYQTSSGESGSSKIQCGECYIGESGWDNWKFNVFVENGKAKVEVKVSALISSTWTKEIQGADSCPSTFYQYMLGEGLSSGDYAYNISRNAGYGGISSTNSVICDSARSGELKPERREVELCRTANYDYISECGCMPASLTDLTSRLYMLLKIAAPALLLIVGGFDLIKSMTAQDEKAINKARQKLVKKFIAAAAVFFIMTIVQFLISILATNVSDTLKCVDYLLNGYNP